MLEARIPDAMAQDETEFDKLLKETREWEARDRERHKHSGMNGDAERDGFAPASRAPSVTTGEFGKNATDVGPSREPPRMLETPKPAGAIRILKAAVKQAQAQPETTRARRKGGWGWIWVVILMYFLFRHFVR